MLNDSALNKNIIEIKNVAKIYEGENDSAVHEISFSVREGEFVCLIGPSGCGKSTLLKLIAGITKETSGTIIKPETVSMSFQSGALFPWLSVYENAALGLRQQGASESKVRQTVGEYLELTNLTDFKEKYPADLSGGQRQRVGIARALAVNPAVLLLDEPFSALDAKTTAELHDDLLAIWQKTGKTIIMVSHLIEEAVSLADRVVLMKEGTIVKIYPVNLAYPRREQTREFGEHVLAIRKDFFL